MSHRVLQNLRFDGTDDEGGRVVEVLPKGTEVHVLRSDKVRGSKKDPTEGPWLAHRRRLGFGTNVLIRWQGRLRLIPGDCLEEI